LSFFSSLSSVVGFAINGSSAASAAKQKMDEGGTVREIITVFAEKTDNEIDDRAVEEICEGVEQVMEVTRIAAVYGLRVAARADEYLPRATGALRQAADLVEIQGPQLAGFARSFSQRASHLADILESQGGPSAYSDDPIRE